ncbi:hypothetical protein [Adhaeribacter aerolatus]|nr:hypothetical protein [Adhaeribacter aerolatus]
MKNINKFLLIPAFAALAIGCSSPVAFQSSEYDDVYYASTDKTVIQDQVVASAATEVADEQMVVEENAVPNPEYSEKNSGTGYSSRDYANTEDYYSDDYLYSSRRYAPYRSGLSYYDLAYPDYSWYNRNSYMYGRSPFYDPFYSSYSYYDPFYSPYYDYGFRNPRIYTGLTVVIGRPYYGGFYGGYPYYAGYGGFNRGWYGGGGYNRYYANSGWYRNDTNNATKVQYGPRRDRSVVPDGNAGTNTGARPRGDAGRVAPGGGGGVVAPGDNRGGRPANADVRSTRARSAGNADTAPDVNGSRNTSPDMARPTDSPERATRVGRQSRSAENAENLVESPADRTVQPNLERERPARRSRVETNDYNFPDQPTRSVEERPSVRPQRRERSTEGYTPETTQPQQRREYEPQRMERQERVREPYQAPRQERTYEAPRRERTYEAPRYEAPRTYDQPSSRPSSGGSSSGSDGGSSSGGRGGRPRN